MPAITLAKSGIRYSHEEWCAKDIEERTHLLSKYGPGYSDEAWQKHFGNRKIRNETKDVLHLRKGKR